MIIQIKISVQITDPNSMFNKVIIFFFGMNFSSLNQNAYYTCHSSKVLKDWEGLPVEKETKVKDFFENSSSKTLVGEKISAQCIAWEAACQYGVYANFYIISQETTEFRRAPIINAFDILRANSNDIFVPEFNIDSR